MATARLPISGSLQQNRSIKLVFSTSGMWIFWTARPCSTSSRISPRSMSSPRPGQAGSNGPGRRFHPVVPPWVMPHSPCSGRARCGSKAATSTSPERVVNSVTWTVGHFFGLLVQGCVLASPWHLRTWSGEHSWGLPFRFSGFPQPWLFSSGHIVALLVLLRHLRLVPGPAGPARRRFRPATGPGSAHSGDSGRGTRAARR